MRADRVDGEPGVEIREQRLAALRPLLDDERVVGTAQLRELRLHVRELALERPDRRIEILGPCPSKLGQKRGFQTGIDDSEHVGSLLGKLPNPKSQSQAKWTFGWSLGFGIWD